MGFGILLFGYTMLIEYGITVSSEFNIGIDIFPDILGYFLMFYATRKLSPYSQGFKNARFMSILMMVLGAATLILPIAALFQKGLPIISTALQYCYFTRDIFVFIFSVFVFAGIRELAKDVDLPKVASKAVTATVLWALYLIPRISIFIVNYTDAQKSFVSILYSIFFYIALLFSVYVLFNCHVRICYEGEEDPETKESVIEKFIKKIKNKPD